MKNSEIGENSSLINCKRHINRGKITDIILNRKLFKENKMNGNEQEVILISGIETLRWISTVVSISVKFILAIYFLNKYSKEKTGIPLAWGTGFFFFGLSQIPVMAMRYFEDTTTNMAFALLAALLAALSLVLLYYGTSLLFFKKGSFMRGRLSILFFVVMLVVIAAFAFLVPIETVLKSVFIVVAAGFIFPIVLIIAILFFVMWHKLEPANPRRANVFLVAVAWLIYSIINGVGAFYFLELLEWIFYILAIVAFVILLYGMTVGKATGH